MNDIRPGRCYGCLNDHAKRVCRGCVPASATLGVMVGGEVFPSLLSEKYLNNLAKMLTLFCPSSPVSVVRLSEEGTEL